MPPMERELRNTSVMASKYSIDHKLISAGILQWLRKTVYIAVKHRNRIAYLL